MPSFVQAKPNLLKVSLLCYHLKNLRLKVVLNMVSIPTCEYRSPGFKSGDFYREGKERQSQLTKFEDQMPRFAATKRQCHLITSFAAGNVPN